MTWKKSTIKTKIDIKTIWLKFYLFVFLLPQMKMNKTALIFNWRISFGAFWWLNNSTNFANGRRYNSNSFGLGKYVLFVWNLYSFENQILDGSQSWDRFRIINPIQLTSFPSPILVSLKFDLCYAPLLICPKCAKSLIVNTLWSDEKNSEHLHALFSYVQTAPNKEL